MISFKILGFINTKIQNAKKINIGLFFINDYVDTIDKTKYK